MSSTNQSRLKRRTPHGPLAVISPQTRLGSTFTSDGFDLPPSETLLEPPVKRAKPQTDPQEVKKATKKKGKSTVAKEKQAGRKVDDVNVTTSSKPQKETNVAATQSMPKRAAKSSVSVEEADDSGQEAQDKSHDREDAINENKEDQENAEAVEDSHRLNHSATQAALDAADLSVDSKLRDMVAPGPERKKYKPVDNTQCPASSTKEFSIPSENDRR